VTAVISFWWTFWAVQEEPKFLRPVAFPWLQICQKWFCGRSAAPDSARGELTTLPQAPNWIWKEEGMRVGEGREEKGEEERKRKGFWEAGEAEGQSMHPAAMGDTRL